MIISYHRMWTISFLFFLFLAAEQSDAQKSSLAGLPPGAVSTNANGFFMTAKINGKPVRAHAMMPPGKVGEIVGFYDGDKYIGLPYLKNSLAAGKKIDFETENADLITNDPVQVWDGRKGQMEITKVAGKLIEGKFHFTAYSHDNKKSLEVSDGFFRIVIE